MNTLDKITSSIKYINKNAEYVTINYHQIDEVLKKYDFSKCEYWLDSNPYGLLDLPIKELFLFMLVYHAIGDYCFWGTPKWEIEVDGQKIDGSYAIIYLIIKRLKNKQSFKMTFNEFKEFLKGNVEIPLLKERYECLTELNNYLENHDFYEETKDLNDGTSLFNYIINHFKYLEDKSIYKNQEVCFYKRAQLFTSNILHIKKMKKLSDVNYNSLLGCADYKIPQVLHCFKILDYNDELNKLIMNQEQIPAGSEMEQEIRAQTLFVIDYIYKKINGRITKMDINDFIWSLGQDKTIVNIPYHRTLTTWY